MRDKWHREISASAQSLAREAFVVGYFSGYLRAIPWADRKEKDEIKQEAHDEYDTLMKKAKEDGVL